MFKVQETARQPLHDRIGTNSAFVSSIRYCACSRSSPWLLQESAIPGSPVFVRLQNLLERSSSEKQWNRRMPLNRHWRSKTIWIRRRRSDSAITRCSTCTRAIRRTITDTITVTMDTVILVMVTDTTVATIIKL